MNNEIVKTQAEKALEYREKLENSFMSHAINFADSKELKEIFSCFMYEVKRNPAIYKCDPNSILIALSQCAQYGLFPGARQECALIPYGKDLTFQPMVLGIIKLAYDSGFVKSIDSEVFYENDTLDYQQGTDPKLIFKKNYLSERGKRVGAYAVAKLTSGETLIELMSIKEIEQVKKSSKTDKVWSQHWDEMARKTVIKRLLKRIRRSDKLAEVISYDNSLERPDYSAQLEQANAELENVTDTGVLKLTNDCEVVEPSEP